MMNVAFIMATAAVAGILVELYHWYQANTVLLWSILISVAAIMLIIYIAHSTKKRRNIIL